ncbi:hypothetical protein DES53_104369 [Roseimicrobium gellanilyticum]|uniref:Uncharacterized protein n=1 Tax=Roseimicrobium gellanilyticum TaxID=748857 RepID=A0A366HN11_9BACT|nr:hypothetical protein [Roseimicrobium gellanilyticum]RBP44548.1 hypothetical protein DES53_104369 [Roseimicrobium gellanilyticum]
MLRALNRFVRRLPSLLKLMVTVFIAIMATGAFVAKVLDRLGVRGCAPNLEPITWHYWLVLVVGLWMFRCLVRDILWPKLRVEEWTPVHQGDGAIAAQTRAKMRYAYLTTHPSYILVDVLAVLGPAVLMVMAWNEPCHANHQVLMLRSAVALWLPLPLLRLLSWFVLKRGKAALFQHLAENASEEKKSALEWRICWQPVLNLWGLYLAIASLVIGIIAYEQRQEEKNTPLLDTAQFSAAISDPASFGEKRLRVHGTVASGVKEFRGNVRGTGVAMHTDAGPVLVFATGLMSDEFVAMVQESSATGQPARFVANVMPDILPEDARNFGWNAGAFAGDGDFANAPVWLRFVKR